MKYIHIVQDHDREELERDPEQEEALALWCVHRVLVNGHAERTLSGGISESGDMRGTIEEIESVEKFASWLLARVNRAKRALRISDPLWAETYQDAYAMRHGERRNFLREHFGTDEPETKAEEWLDEIAPSMRVEEKDPSR